jgi:hypothetical protein
LEAESQDDASLQQELSNGSQSVTSIEQEQPPPDRFIRQWLAAPFWPQRYLLGVWHSCVQELYKNRDLQAAALLMEKSVGDRPLDRIWDPFIFFRFAAIPHVDPESIKELLLRKVNLLTDPGRLARADSAALYGFYRSVWPLVEGDKTLRATFNQIGRGVQTYSRLSPDEKQELNELYRRLR